MPDRRGAHATTSTTTSTSSVAGVRRNLFHHHLSRRPTASSASTSTDALRVVTTEVERSAGPDIVVRNQSGETEGGEWMVEQVGQEEEEPAEEMEGLERDGEKERQRLVDMVRHHRDRNRAPSEPPGELVEAVKNDLRIKVSALADDNWMYEAESGGSLR